MYMNRSMHVFDSMFLLKKHLVYVIEVFCLSANLIINSYEVNRLNDRRLSLMLNENIKEFRKSKRLCKKNLIITLDFQKINFLEVLKVKY